MPGSKEWWCCDWRRGFINPKPSAYMNATVFSAFRRLVHTKKTGSAFFTRSASHDERLGSVTDVPLREGLQKLLDPVGLTIVVRDEVVVITTKCKPRAKLK